jgi:proteasome lid subunit RPN8/RPN11
VKIIFLDIDGPIIPNGMFLLDRNCSFGRNIPPIPVAVVAEVCRRADAKVVFNTTHNISIDNVLDIEFAMIRAGLPEAMIHPDMKTKYPQLNRANAVVEWLHRHPETTDWIAFDDVKFTEKPNLIWVDPDAGLHVGHLNEALSWWGISQFLIL